mmetsp:Transcript_113193/g.320665  ORF Transcript_113193/g.320665 Transcript_113193/m.320665 type:complete len:118 (+) Transcript_113193:157-510(+)
MTPSIVDVVVGRSMGIMVHAARDVTYQHQCTMCPLLAHCWLLAAGTLQSSKTLWRARLQRRRLHLHLYPVGAATATHALLVFLPVHGLARHSPSLLLPFQKHVNFGLTRMQALTAWL